MQHDEATVNNNKNNCTTTKNIPIYLHMQCSKNKKYDNLYQQKKKEKKNVKHRTTKLLKIIWTHTVCSK